MLAMTEDPKPAPAEETAKPAPTQPAASEKAQAKPQEMPRKIEEIGGPPGPEPTRYGDWQFNGKVTDF